jgi:outer membrane protein OmpA-like peptidoglycan-associated protein
VADAEHQARFGDALALPTGVHHRVVVRRPRFDLRVIDCFGAPAPDVFAALALPDATIGMLTDDEGRARRSFPEAEGITAPLSFPEVGSSRAEIPEPDPAATPWAGEDLDVAVEGEHVVQLPPRVHRVRLVGFLFDTDKTFLLPESLAGIRQLATIWERHRHAHVLVVGHTDTVGQPAHNGPLSEERAESVAAYLRDDVDAWLAFYEPIGHTSARWGVPEDKHMLSHLADEAGLAFYRGPIDAISFDAATKTAVERFQAWSNAIKGTTLEVDGVLGPKTRRALVTAYMAEDGTTLPDTVEVATHGCGENHPIEPTGDEVEAQPNRRVEAFLFEAGIVPPPPPKGSGGACEEYPAWKAQVGIDIDVSDRPPALVAAAWER